MVYVVGLVSPRHHASLHPNLRSVPSGRIGSSKDDVYRSNEEYRDAVAAREMQDIAEVEAKMGRR